MLGATDEQQLAFALSEGRVLFTYDRDFLRLAAEGRPHAGIAYASRRTSVGQIIRGLLLIHQVLSSEDMVGKVEYL